MISPLQVTLFFLSFLNLIAFLVMWIDKVKAQNSNKIRISEGMIFFLATLFGSLGVYAGMYAFRHKTRKWYFRIGIPLLALQNFIFLYVLSEYIMKKLSV